MTKGILGKKGMTQIFTESGEFILLLSSKQLQTLCQENVEQTVMKLFAGFDDKRGIEQQPAKGHVAKVNTAPKRSFVNSKH